MMSQTLFSRLFSAMFFNSSAYYRSQDVIETQPKKSITAQEEARRAAEEREKMLAGLSPEDRQRFEQYERMALRQGIMEVENQSQQRWTV